MPRLSSKALVMIILTAGIAIAAIAQDRDKKHEERRPVNLKVLSKKITHDSLMALMREYSVSLGVRCGFCHVKSQTDEKHLDFASDDNGKKKIARYMMRMTADLNKKYFAEENQGTTKLMISCYTCHHGHEEPEAFVMPKEEEHH